METKTVNNYQFTITISGIGETPEVAWNDAVEGFTLNPGDYDPLDKVEVIEENI